MGTGKIVFRALLMTALLAFRTSAAEADADGSARAARMARGGIEIACESFTLRFASDGLPASLRSNRSGEELLNTREPGKGFEVLNRVSLATGDDRYAWRLGELSLADDGRTLIAENEDGSQAVHLGIHIGEDYISFSIERLVGFSSVPDLALRFSFNSVGGAGARILSHNHMATDASHGGSNAVVWPILWNVREGDDPGGFSLYIAGSPAQEDDMLLHIWSETEDIAHPKIDGEWDYEAARQWLQAWQEMVAARSAQVSIETDSLDELKEASRILYEQGDIDAVNLMPWIWRGEYWPIKQGTADINTEIFPEGEKSFKAYSDYLAGMGVELVLHWVSGGIGFQDPEYVGTNPDHRFASWGSGRVAAAVDAETREIHIRPDPGTAPPYRLPGSASRGFGTSANFKPALRNWFKFNFARIGTEIVRFSSLEDTDRPVWRLLGCRRGFGSTEPQAHPAGEDVAGLVAAYGQNLVPDNHSTLLGEIARAKAEMCNRCNIPQVNFDGFEIHKIYGSGSQKFAELVYAALDHPTSAHTSGGAPPDAWFEYRFNSSRALERDEADTLIRTALPSRPASSLLMAHHDLGNAAGRNGVYQWISSGDRGFYLDDYRRHGRAREILEAGKTWRRIDAALSADERGQIETGSIRRKKLALRGNHCESPVVYLPQERDYGWDLAPWTSLPTGPQDSTWYSGQENGPVEPWRYIQLNREYLWENPHAAQEPRFYIHVLPAFDYADGANISLQPAAEEMSQTGDSVFADGDGGLLISCGNKRSQGRWQEQNLPLNGVERPRDFSKHRGIGLFVEGDGKGETLLLQFGSGMMRDYVVPIDFKGRRYVEIPDGRACRAMESAWGWRYNASKKMNYAHVREIRIGFGYVPGNTDARVAISGLKALKEIPAALVDPVIETEHGRLALEGEIPSDHYLEYLGGNTASVYDANWNKVGELPVGKMNFTVGKGQTPISVKSEQAPLPWLEIEFLTRGKAIRVERPDFEREARQ